MIDTIGTTGAYLDCFLSKKDIVYMVMSPLIVIIPDKLDPSAIPFKSERRGNSKTKPSPAWLCPIVSTVVQET